MRPGIVITTVLAGALAAAGVARAKDCTDVSGPFSAVPPASCASPVGICTHGQLTGGLTASYDFVADTQSVVFPIATLTGHVFDFATGGTGTYTGTICKHTEGDEDE
jgi:hypothetical protein